MITTETAIDQSVFSRCTQCLQTLTYNHVRRQRSTSQCSQDAHNVYRHSCVTISVNSLITRWFAILAFATYRGIAWRHNHYAGLLRSDTHIRCHDHLWRLPRMLIININFTQYYARYYQYFTCRCSPIR